MRRIKENLSNAIDDLVHNEFAEMVVAALGLIALSLFSGQVESIMRNNSVSLPQMILSGAVMALAAIFVVYANKDKYSWELPY